MRPQLIAHIAAFFVGTMVCHGELARRRPTIRHLTEFYFWMSFGGCLGGLFNAVLAPLVFPVLYEYGITLLLAAPLVPSFRAASERLNTRTVDVLLVLIGGVGIFLMRFIGGDSGTATVVISVTVAIPVLIVLLLADQARAYLGVVGLLLLIQQWEPPFAGELLFSERSFFGVSRVLRDPEGRFHQLAHGSTVHGMQSLSPERSCEPLAYYHPTGPLGDVFKVLDERLAGIRATRGQTFAPGAAQIDPRPNSTSDTGSSNGAGSPNEHGARQRVALVGLGAGAAVAYRQPGRHFTVYEIDPVVKKIAETASLFRYLSDCGCDSPRPAGSPNGSDPTTGERSYDIVLGDGRLRLREAPPHAFSMILFDAFSSDAIPTHLLTRESIDEALAKLAPNGLLAFHISNLHLDLAPVLGDLAADRQLNAVIRQDLHVSDPEYELGKSPSVYVVLARPPVGGATSAETSDGSAISRLLRLPGWSKLPASASPRAWTDDYCNVLRTIR